MRILNFDQFNDEIGLAATLSFKFGPGWSIVRKRGHPFRITQPPQILSGVRDNGVTLEIQYRTRVKALIRQMLTVLFFSSLQPFQENALPSRVDKSSYVEVETQKTCVRFLLYG